MHGTDTLCNTNKYLETSHFSQPHVAKDLFKVYIYGSKVPKNQTRNNYWLSHKKWSLHSYRPKH